MTTIDLANLGIGGTRIDGVAADDALGFFIAGPAGDLNNDFVDDLLLVASGVNGDTGAVYVVFGGNDTFNVGSVLATDLANLGDGGYRLLGINTDDFTGFSSLGLGDFNGDGIDDFAIGTADGGTNSQGMAFIVLGSDSDTSNINLASLGGRGATFVGADANDYLGASVGVTDFNGDGRPDLLLGARGDDTAAADAGAVFVIFGQDGAPGGVDVTINGASLSSIGRIVTGGGLAANAFQDAAGGDIDNDGFGDLLIAGDDNVVHVVLGRDSPGASVDLDNLGDGGFTITAPTGTTIYDLDIAKDINRDGRDDILIGLTGTTNNRGAVYVVFGRDDATDINLNSLGADGIRIDGIADNDELSTVGGVQGDFNGDGANDFAIGTTSTDRRAYIIFGDADLPQTIDLANLSDDAGIELLAPANGNNAVRLFPSGAGSVNGDTLADLQIGSSSLGTNGEGAEFVVYGAFSAAATDGDDSFTGGNQNDSMVGGAGNDSLSGNAGDDSLFGGAGDDSLFGSIGNDLLDGGAGNDTLDSTSFADTVLGGDGNDLMIGGGGDDSLNGGQGTDAGYGQDGNDTLVGGTEADSLFGNGDDDSIMGGAGDDSLKGQVGNDTIAGEDGGDVAFAGGNDDVIDGGAGSDTLNGNSGFDTVMGGAGNDTVRGQGGRDSLDGGDGNDLLLGMQGFDTLVGGAGDDTLIGGPANDTLTGGTGIDTFTFGAGQGANTITDFADGSERILIQGFVFADLTIASNGGNALITVAGDDLTITVNGIAANQLTAADFIFG